MTLAILIASFNEGPRLARSLSNLLTQLRAGLVADTGILVSDVSLVVVDDGSVNSADLSGVDGGVVRIHSLRHSINLGQGAALQTALEFARDVLKADFFVTMDADGQHRPEDLPALLKPVVDEKADFVFGNRFASGTVEAPFFRQILLRAATHFEAWVTGLRLQDSHNGFRAWNKKAAQVIHLKQNRMAHATEFKQIVAREKLNYVEVPVQIHYSSETLAKGQSNLGSFRILRDLLKLYLFDRSTRGDL